MGKSHLAKYRGLTWEPFLECHQGCHLRLRPIEIAPTVMEFNFRDKNRLDLEEKMGDSLHFARWDRVNLPWERKHFFDVSLPTRLHVYLYESVLTGVDGHMGNEDIPHDC